MDEALRQRAAVVALLRLPAVSWSQAAATVLERGEATSVLSEQLGEDGALFSLGADAQARIEAAAAEISTWEAEGIGVHTVLDDTFPERARARWFRPPSVRGQP